MRFTPHLGAPHNPLAPGENGRLRTIREVEFTENVRNMALNRLFAQDKRFGHLSIALSCRNEPEHVHLPVCQLRENIHRIIGPESPLFPDRQTMIVAE